MTRKVRCKSRFCRNLVLPETANDNDGHCAPCYKRINPESKAKTKQQRLFEIQLAIPVSDLTDRQLMCHLIDTIELKEISRFKELIEHSISIAWKAPQGLLTQAIDCGSSIEVLKNLLLIGCDANHGRNRTPLEVAVGNENFAVAEWLLRNGADPNNGRPIVSAISRSISKDTQLRLLALLLENGADVNKTFALYGDEANRFTVLDWAVLYDISSDVIQYLQSNGANHSFSKETICELKSQLKPRRIVP